jgi:uncharacterized protein YjeT (DUF2065 family)
MLLAVASVNPGDVLKMVGAAMVVAGTVLAAWICGSSLRGF